MVVIRLAIIVLLLARHYSWSQHIPEETGVLQQFRRYIGYSLNLQIYQHKSSSMAGATNPSHAECANMCIAETAFTCRSFVFSQKAGDISGTECIWSEGSPNTDGRLAFMARNDSTVMYMRNSHECDSFLVDKLPEKCPTPLGMKKRLLGIFRGSVVPSEIVDAQFRASSAAGANYTPGQGRYDGPSCWKPHAEDRQPWIQVGFRERRIITGLVLQGCGEDDLGWVQLFRVFSATNGNPFVVHKDRISRKEVFEANVEPRCGSLVTLDPWLYTDVIRILAVRWYRSVGLRFEILGCLDGCDSSLGLMDGVVSDSALTASSATGGAGPSEARIQPLQIQMIPSSGWRPVSDRDQWIQVRFPEVQTVRSIITQGCARAYAAGYIISYSSDDEEVQRGVFQTYNHPASGQPLTFLGNADSTTLVRHNLPGEFNAIYVRITPVAWGGNGRCMKFELIGCPFKDCNQPLDVSSNVEVEGHMRCSPTSFAIHGSSGTNREQTFTDYPVVTKVPLTIRLDEEYTITAITTQGSLNEQQYGPTWANKFTLQYERDTGDIYAHGLQYYLDMAGDVMTFLANFDSNTPVTNRLFRPIAATRLVLTYYNDEDVYPRVPCIRVGLSGCPVAGNGPLCGPVGVEAEGYCMAAIPNSNPDSCSSIFHATSYPAIVNSPRRNEIFGAVLEELQQPGFDMYYIGLQQRGKEYRWADGTPLIYSMFDASAPGSRCPAIIVGDRSRWGSPVCGTPSQAGGTLCQFDLNECLKGTSGCPKGCINYPGGFACECNVGEYYYANECNSLCVKAGFETSPVPNYCQKTYSEPSTYDEASATCGQDDGTLVTPHIYAGLVAQWSGPGTFPSREVWIPSDKVQPNPDGPVLCSFAAVNDEPPPAPPIYLSRYPCDWKKPFICLIGGVPTVNLHLTEEPMRTNVSSSFLYMKWLGIPPWFDQLKHTSLDIQVPDELVISFEIIQVTLREIRHGECLDILYITEHLPSGIDNQHTPICGTLPAFSMLTATNHVEVALHIGKTSVMNIQHHLSVQLFYEAKDCRTSECIYQCPSRYTPIRSSSGGFTTFGFPRVLPPLYSCRWTIITDPGLYLRMDISEVDIEEGHPIEVYIRKLNDSQIDETRFEVVTSPIWIFSETNKAIISYETGVIHQSRGFRVAFTPTAGPIEAPGCEIVPKSLTGDCPRTECNLPKAYLSSPNYPAFYSSRTDCSYTVTTAAGSHIWVHLMYLEQEGGDRSCEILLMIYERNVRVRICPWLSSPPPYKSGVNTLTIAFQTGHRKGRFMVAYEEKYFETPEYGQISERDSMFSCPGDWQLFNGRCYKLLVRPGNLRWTDALSFCRALGNSSELVSIRNTAEASFIQEMLVKRADESTKFYIGLQSDLASGRYMWVDGLPLSYTDWYIHPFEYDSRQPDGGRAEACTAIELTNFQNTRNWVDIPCAEPMTDRMICAQPAGIVDPEAVPIKPVTFHTEECPKSFYRIADKCLNLVYFPKGETANVSSYCNGDSTIAGKNFVSEHLDQILFYHSNMWRLPDYYHFIVDDTVDGIVCLRPQGGRGLEGCNPELQLIVLCIADAKAGEQQRCRDGQFQCSSGECIQTLFVNDFREDCLDGSDEVAPSSTGLERDDASESACSDPSFMRCQDSYCIQATLFCDFKQDCFDGSDELDCVFPECNELEFTCSNGQCISQEKYCDLVPDCVDGSDESDCNGVYPDSVFQCYSGYALPSYVYCDGYRDCSGKVFEDEPASCGYFDDSFTCDETTQIQCDNEVCTDKSNVCMMDEDVYGIMSGCRDVTHLRNCDLFECSGSTFKCPDYYCIPQHYRCNGRIDCPGREDEMDCESYKCESGSYRCHGTLTCLSQQFVCDGRNHCPEGDDELYCGYQCPPGCSCVGMSFTCPSVSWDRLAADMIPRRVKQLMLPFISINGRSRRAAESDHGTIEDVTYINVGSYPLLLSLDLSGNGIRHLGNSTFASNKMLNILNLSYNEITTLQSNAFLGLEKLQILDLRGNRDLWHIEGAPFHNLGELRQMYLQETSLETSDPAIVQGLTNIRTFHSDRFYYCCLLNDFEFVQECLPEQGEFSSCTDLIRNPTLRVAMWILGMSALCGNLSVIVWRIIRQVIMKRQRRNPVQTLLVFNLAIADFFMGCYMLMVAAADVHFRDTYAIYSDQWQTSFWCRLAGFLSTLSSVSSVMFLTVISVDRCHNVVFPFSRHHLRLKSSMVVAGSVWIIVMILGILPAIIYENDYYGRSSVCLALPITAQRLDGWAFSFALFIIMTLVLFLIIVACYVGIFYVAYNSSKASRNVSVSDKQLKNDQLQMAAKVLFLVGTDFLCWVPIIIMGFLALTPMAVSGDVYAWTAVFILPVNSALNPYLYTFLVERASKIKNQQSTISNTRNETLPESVPLTETKKPQNQESRKGESGVSRTALNTLRMTRLLGPLPKETVSAMVLSTLLTKPGFTLLETDKEDIVRDVGKGLEHLHKQGITHGEVSEDFVVIDESSYGNKRAFLLMTFKSSTGGHAKDSNIFEEDTEQLRELSARLDKLVVAAAPAADNHTKDEQV